MYTDKKIRVRLVGKLHSLVECRIAVIRPGVIHADVLIAVVKNLFQLQHDRQVNVLLIDSLLVRTDGSSSVPRIDYDYFIIDFMRCQKIKIKILRIIFRLQFIYLVGRDLYHAHLPLPGVGETVNIVAVPQNRVAVKISAVRLRDFHPDSLGHIIVADSNPIPGHALRQADTQFSLRPRRFILLFDL